MRICLPNTIRLFTKYLKGGYFPPESEMANTFIISIYDSIYLRMPHFRASAVPLYLILNSDRQGKKITGRFNKEAFTFDEMNNKITLQNISNPIF